MKNHLRSIRVHCIDLIRPNESLNFNWSLSFFSGSSMSAGRYSESTSHLSRNFSYTWRNIGLVCPMTKCPLKSRHWLRLHSAALFFVFSSYHLSARSQFRRFKVTVNWHPIRKCPMYILLFAIVRGLLCKLRRWVWASSAQETLARGGHAARNA